MSNIVFPNEVFITLRDARNQPLAISNILFQVHTFARRKNDFFLGPYPTKEQGIAHFTKTELEMDVQATYDSGLMDYMNVGDCSSFVEIELLSERQIQQALKSRTEVWVRLLKGERERWGTMENLLRAYRESRNRELNVEEDFSKIRAEWDGTQATCTYDFVVSPVKSTT